MTILLLTERCYGVLSLAVMLQNNVENVKIMELVFCQNCTFSAIKICSILLFNCYLLYGSLYVSIPKYSALPTLLRTS